MQVVYSAHRVEELCTNEKKAILKYGPIVGKKLIDLMILLEEAPNLFDISRLPQYRLHPLTGDRKNQISLTIHKSSKYRLILYPYNKEGELLKNSERIDERFIETIKIEIEEVSEHYGK